MDPTYRSRKFILACIMTAASIAGLFFGHLSEQSFVVLVGGILGLYGYHNLKEKG